MVQRPGHKTLSALICIPLGPDWNVVVHRAIVEASESWLQGGDRHAYTGVQPTPTSTEGHPTRVTSSYSSLDDPPRPLRYRVGVFDIGNAEALLSYKFLYQSSRSVYHVPPGLASIVSLPHPFLLDRLGLTDAYYLRTAELTSPGTKLSMDSRSL